MGFWVLLFWIATSLVVELIRPKPTFEDARPAKLGDFQFPTATEGRCLPLIWGTVQIKGPNLVWYGNYRKGAITEEVKTGLFSSDDVVTGYRYYVGMQFGLCHGEVDELSRIWINEKDVTYGAGTVNSPNLFGGEETGQGGIQGSLDFYPGSITQSADSYLSGFQSPTPAYRGVCYAVFDGWIGNTNNVAPWAFELKRIPDGLNLASVDPGAEAPNSGKDANPMNILYEILTNTDWGLAIDSSDIDIPNFQAVASTLADEGNGFSMVLDNVIEVTKLIEEVQRQIDGSLFFNRDQGQWQVTLARADYDPDDLDLFDESNVIELKEYSRRTWEETSNQVRISYADRNDKYKDTFALAQDPANMDIQGQTIQTDMSFPGVKVGALANKLAWRELRTLSYPLAKVVFSVNREGFNLMPGGVFKFSWSRLGVEEMIFRVSAINYGKLGESKIEVDAIQDVFDVESGAFSDPTISEWANAEVEAAAPEDSLVFEAPRQMVLQSPYKPLLNPRVWMGCRYPGGGTLVIHSYDRAGTAQPIGTAYELGATISKFLVTGTLTYDLDAYGSSSTRPDSSYNIDVDEEDDLSSLVIDGDEVLIQELTCIAYCDGEWLGWEKCEALGGGVYRLSRLWRGLFNSAPKAHASGTRVWFISVGGNLTKRILTSSQDEMDIQLRGTDAGGTETAEGETPELEVHIDRLYKCPLAPRDPVVNGNYAPASEDIDTSYTSETGQTGDDALAMEIEVSPRDWDRDDPTTDHDLRTTWIDDDPEFEFVLQLDPDGTPIDVGPYPIDSTTTPTAYVLRNDIIIAVGDNASIPSTGKIIVTSKHTLDSVLYTNPYDMEFPLGITSALQSADDLTHGAVDDGTSPAVVTYGETGNYTFDIHKALPSSGRLEARINGGGWATVVAASATTGVLAVTAGDEIELRRQAGAPTYDQFFDITGPTSEVGYGVILA